MSGEKITEEGGELVVSVPLLTKLDAMATAQAAGFAAVTTKLDGKADKADVARLESRLDTHASKIAALEAARHDTDVAANARNEDHTAVLTRRQKFWGGFGVAALVLSSLLVPVISHFINFR